MPNDGEEIRYRGVRKRKWGKYVAEIRSTKRSRISLGSYSTPHAAARAYDAALLCLRGPDSTSFNFPDSKFNSKALEVASADSNPPPQAIRTTAIAVGSAYDVIPPADDEEAGLSIRAGTSMEEAAPPEASTQSRDAVKDKAVQVEEEEEKENDTKYLLKSPEHIPFEESLQMPPLQPDLQFMAQPYDNCDVFPDLGPWDAAPDVPP